MRVTKARIWAVRKKKFLLDFGVEVSTEENHLGDV
jgi:hypothetical protein